MRLLRIATMVAPLLMRGQPKRSSRTVIELFLAIVFGVIGSMALITAGFIYIKNISSLEVAFLSLGGLLLVPSIFLLIKLSYKPRRLKAAVSNESKTDLLQQNLPESLTENPNVKPVIKFINEHPLSSTAAALTVGILLANEFFGD